MSKKFKVLREMTDADPRRVSLVDHASTKIPFRIQKRDGAQNMNTLKNAILAFSDARRTVLKSDTKALPVLAAIVLKSKPADGADMDRITALVAKAGFKTDKPVVNKDETFMFQQADFDQDDESGDTRILAVTPDLAMVLKGFAPWTDSLENFDEILAAQGMFNGLGTACNALNTAISMKMQSASDPGEAATEVKAVLAAFTSYVETLVGALPANAFKFESEFSPLVATIKSEAKKREDDTAVAKAETDRVAAETLAVEKAGWTKPDDMKQEDWDALDDAGKKAKTKKADPVVKSEAIDAAAITAAVLAGITPQFEAINTTIGNLSAAQTALNAKVTEVATKSDETAGKIAGIVLGGARAPENASNASKAAAREEAGPFGGFTDTARNPGWNKRK